MKNAKRFVALLLAAVLLLGMVLPASAAQSHKEAVMQALKNLNDTKNPAPDSMYVYPYAQTGCSATVQSGKALLLQFHYDRMPPGANNLFVAAICRGAPDVVAEQEEPDIVETHVTGMVSFQGTNYAFTWFADSKYPVGEYSLLAFVMNSDGIPYEGSVFITDLHVVDKHIPATDMELWQVDHGEYVEGIPTELQLHEGFVLVPALTPYVNTSVRDVRATSSNPDVVSVGVQNGYIYCGGIGYGSAEVRITCGSITKSLKINVEGIESIEFSVKEKVICNGLSDWIEVRYEPSDWPAYIDVYSEDPSIATIKDGVVTAISPGTVNIVAACGSYVAKATYTVVAHDLPEDTPVSERTATKPAIAKGYCSRCGRQNSTNIVEPAVFADTSGSAWYSDHVDYVYDQKIMNGSSATTFAPDRTMTRAELVTVLYRLAGSPEVEGELPFTDVEAGQWYSDAVLWANQNEIVNGVGNGRFAPTANITREQIATILYRYSKFTGIEMAEGADLTTFPDSGKVADFALEGMAWAVAEGLITGTVSGGTTTLSPQASATRAQLATIISRYQQMFR